MTRESNATDKTLHGEVLLMMVSNILEKKWYTTQGKQVVSTIEIKRLWIEYKEVLNSIFERTESAHSSTEDSSILIPRRNKHPMAQPLLGSP